MQTPAENRVWSVGDAPTTATMAANNHHSSGNSHPNFSYHPHAPSGSHHKRVRSELNAEVPQCHSPEYRAKLSNHTYTTSNKGAATNGFANPSNYMIPAVLLSPRSHTYALNNTLSRQPAFPNRLNASNSSDPLEFQFSSPNEDNMSSMSTPASLTDRNGYSHAPTPYNDGYSNMIERANNVEERTSAPQSKRRRVEAEDISNGNHNFGGGGGSGILGQYVKEKRDQATKTAVGVDLIEVEDDDSDVIEVTNMKDQEVCFGMIEGAKIQCHLVPSPKPGTLAIMQNMWPVVKIMLNRKHGDPNNIIHVKDHTRQIVGSVDSHTASGLTPLLDSRLQLRTDCRIPTRRKEPGEKEGTETSKLFPLDLMLYGPRKSGKVVGRHLMSRGLHLRHPPRVEAGIRYENPQAVDAPRPPPAVKAQFTPAISQYHTPPAARTVEEIRSEVMGVFDTLTLSEDLPQMEPDSRILTELLLHQKQGLNFMMTKEKPRQLNDNGNTPNSFWQIRMGNSGQRSYYNVITSQTQRDSPPETYGGILADMMGLGKTLSILSLVTSSLDAAEGWSKTLPIQPSQAPAPKKKPGFEVPVPEPLGLMRVTRNARATLLVCPLSTVTNWEEQIKAHIKPGTFTYYVYHGSNRKKDPKELAKYDMVITTYHTVSTDLKARKRSSAAPLPLEEISWFRIVLDEAHIIREQRTLMFTAIARLPAHRRWAVTGTPVQNRLDDLAALLAFIRLKPFDDKNKFTQYIVSPFKLCDPEIVPKLRVLVDSVTLRRLKDKINLPKRTDQIIRLKFSPAEEKIYKVFEQNAQDKVQVLSQGRDRMVGGKTYIHILQSILRLRLISAHGRDLLNDEDLKLVQGMTEDSAIDLDSDEDDAEKLAKIESKAYRNFHLMEETNSNKCFFCQIYIGANMGNDDVSEREGNTLGYISGCAHLFCSTCKPAWDENVGDQGSGDCPICRSHGPFSLTPILKDKAENEHDTHNHSGNKAKTINANGYSGPHTKTKALLDDLLRAKKESEKQPDEPPFKSVVFSAWTSHLDLIQIALDNAGICHVRLDGKMQLPARTKAMDRFREDNSVHVILVSIMAGGLGLNLTAANNVYVMEPQYNPAAEAQAVDRVHRLGQKREVRSVRYIMQNSIEEKMLLLQEKKMKLASLSMDRNKVMDKAEAAKQKLEDLRSLFK